MLTIEPNQSLPGSAVPYVLRVGAGEHHLLAGQVIRTLASARETNDTFGVVIATAPRDPMPVPMHWHEKEHDTWLCMQGELQVWSDGDSRVLLPGDFAYVRPSGVHSYLSHREGTEFFGLVTPGNWVDFFIDAGEDWATDSYPPVGTHPLNFPKLMAAMGKYKINRVPDAPFTDARRSDDDLSIRRDCGSYYLRARHGDRHLLGGHIGFALAGTPQNGGAFGMRTIEANTGATMPRHHHQNSHELIYVTAGALELQCADSVATLYPGMAASIPAGVPHATRVLAPRSGWITSHSDPRADLMFEICGEPTSDFMHPCGALAEPDWSKLTGAADVILG